MIKNLVSFTVNDFSFFKKVVFRPEFARSIHFWLVGLEPLLSTIKNVVLEIKKK
jgi:hypothetical protein